MADADDGSFEFIEEVTLSFEEFSLASSWKRLPSDAASSDHTNDDSSWTSVSQPSTTSQYLPGAGRSDNAMVDFETPQELPISEQNMLGIAVDHRENLEQDEQVTIESVSIMDIDCPPLSQPANPITHIWGRDGHPSALSESFLPPYHLIHEDGGFEGALALARERRCFLLVNLQSYSDSNFGCFAINRDIWRHDLVQAMIQTSFVFWQADVESRDGAAYARHFVVHKFPHIAIVHPNHRSIIWGQDGWTSENPWRACDVVQRLADVGFDRAADLNLEVKFGNEANDPFVADPPIDISQECELQRIILDDSDAFMTAEQIEEFCQVQWALAISSNLE